MHLHVLDGAGADERPSVMILIIEMGWTLFGRTDTPDVTLDELSEDVRNTKTRNTLLHLHWTFLLNARIASTSSGENLFAEMTGITRSGSLHEREACFPFPKNHRYDASAANKRQDPFHQGG